jgi:hypothetical protein
MSIAKRVQDYRTAERMSDCIIYAAIGINKLKLSDPDYATRLRIMIGGAIKEIDTPPLRIKHSGVCNAGIISE